MTRFEWDPEKAKRNLSKHGVRFSLVLEFQFETCKEWLDDRDDYGEERIRAIGLIGTGLYVLIYAMRKDSIRVISLRRATRKEANEYVSS
ncbi:hypothetical protein SAMN05428967_1942 [Phyllobacterium sp. YR620]|uniref:BrnT family toxin n=1 Tax=unclassified Phyllobacterium TaxID=2638441 RepID=UPI00048755CE|nr:MULTISPECIES: BrnT family toxin [unclassified Phyllobacterium]SDP39973.1 hypothetical protein SAMN05428967_1942 [Phyllobacterium sp. YR620]